MQKKTIYLSKIPDVLTDKVNTFIKLFAVKNPRAKDETEIKAVKRRMISTIRGIIKTRKAGFKEAVQYVNGLTMIEKKRLNFNRLCDQFDNYTAAIQTKLPNMPHSFAINIWDVVLNQALVKGEDSALLLLESIKAKNLETLDKSEEE